MSKFIKIATIPLLVIFAFLIPFDIYGLNVVNAGFISWATGVGNQIGLFIAGMFLQLGGWLLWLAGLLFNESVNLSIVSFSSAISGANSFINETWGVMRDLVNMSFIFILLYIAFQIILGIKQNAQKLIITVIWVALLVNFSLPITKVIIDASNIIAVEFYNNITKPEGATSAFGTDVNDTGISDIFMNQFKLGTIYNTQGITSEQLKLVGDKLVLVGVIGFILMTIAAGVFFMIAVSFIIRMAILIFLMITSPIMFLGQILPGIPSKLWWKTLLDQAFFAPVFMLFMWIVVKMITSDAFSSSLLGISTSQSSFADAFLSSGNTSNSGSIALFINFGIIIVFLIMSLKVAKKLGAQGTDWALKVAGGVALGGAAFAARSTVGKAANRFANSDWLKDRAEKSAVGAGVLRGTKAIASGSLDLRAATPIKAAAGVAGVKLGKTQKGGYEGTLKRQVASREKFAKSLGDRKVAKVDSEGNEVVDTEGNIIMEDVSRTKEYAERIGKPTILSKLTLKTKADKEASKKILKPIEKKEETKKRTDRLKEIRREIVIAKTKSDQEKINKLEDERDDIRNKDRDSRESRQRDEQKQDREGEKSEDKSSEREDK